METELWHSDAPMSTNQDCSEVPYGLLRVFRVTIRVWHINEFDTICPICSAGCLHEYCLNCCKRHAEAKLTSGSLQMECPDPSCVHSFTMDQCRTLLSKSNFTTLNIRLTETAIPAPLRVYCPFKDCSAFMEKSESDGTFAECYFCHREFCQACNAPWHNNQTCGEYRANEMNSRLSGDQKFRELAKQKKWQTCPDCKSFVERTEGCKHMTCVCKVEFCYLCGMKYVNNSLGCTCCQ